MKSDSYKDRLAAFNADVEPKLKAISGAVSPDERALREERQKQIEAQSTRAMSPSETYPYAPRAALSYGALPLRGPADSRLIKERERHEYQSNLLRRLGLEATVPVTMKQMWKAAHSLGFAPEEFGGMSPVDLCEVLEAKATVLERLRGIDYTAGLEVLKETLNLKGGQQPGTPVDRKKLKDLRKECDTSQEGLASTCDVSVDSIARGEAGGRWSRDIFEQVASGLSRLLSRRISPEDLGIK